MDLVSFLDIFRQYTYLAIFPVAVLEGPIISIISGLLVSQGVLSFLPALFVVFLGDFLSDIFLYYIGRQGKRAVEKWKILHLDDARLGVIVNEYHTSPWKTMFIAKVSYGLGMAFMVGAGLVGMSQKKFILTMAGLNLARSFVLLVGGYYFGKLLLQFSEKYFGWYNILVIIIVPIGYYLVWKMRKSRTESNH